MEDQGWFEGDLVERNQSKNYDVGFEAFPGSAMEGIEVMEKKPLEGEGRAMGKNEEKGHGVGLQSPA